MQWGVASDHYLDNLILMIKLFFKNVIILITFFKTSSYAALRAADLNWIVGPGYFLGGNMWRFLK